MSCGAILVTSRSPPSRREAPDFATHVPCQVVSIEVTIGFGRRAQPKYIEMMGERDVLKHWIVEALDAAGGGARVVDVCKHIWNNHENELRAAGDLFYTWQYEVRWAAQMLRDAGALAAASPSRRGWWEINRSK